MQHITWVAQIPGVGLVITSKLAASQFIDAPLTLGPQKRDFIMG